jgi:N-terminal acetyltransferase B complex catalytic subunit
LICKVEGEEDKEELHGHISAITVSNNYRGLKLASELMKIFDFVSEKIYNCFYIDLFVRGSN